MYLQNTTAAISGVSAQKGRWVGQRGPLGFRAKGRWVPGPCVDGMRVQVMPHEGASSACQQASARQHILPPHCAHNLQPLIAYHRSLHTMWSACGLSS